MWFKKFKSYHKLSYQTLQWLIVCFLKLWNTKKSEEQSVEYPKINSLWKRQSWYFEVTEKKDNSFRPSFIEGDYANPEFGLIKKWHVTEKIDGTNIRIFYEDGKVRFGGRTSNAQLPVRLLDYLQNHFTEDRLEAAFKDGNNIIIFGEGYGPKIQSCGSNYRKDAGFILFDVWVNGWWLKREDVKQIAEKLEIPCVPELGYMKEEEVVHFVKSKPLSKCSEIPQMMEGVICRTDPPLHFRNGQPLMWKLKCKEFRE